MKSVFSLRSRRKAKQKHCGGQDQAFLSSIRSLFTDGSESGTRYQPLQGSSSANMATKATIWQDIVQYRRAYILTAVASFGGMLFGWDTGITFSYVLQLLGHILTLVYQVLSAAS